MSEVLKKLTQEYIEDVLVRLAHHSSAIEGNTITLPETVTIILNQTLPSNSKITSREYFEVLNHEQAFEYILNNIENDVPLSVSTIQDIHELLTDRLQHDKGQFKKGVNYIQGVDFDTAPPEEALQLTNQFVDNLDYQLQNSETDEEKIRAILESHIVFEKIHPFSDGNGRVGRMLINYSLIENDLPPLVIKKEDKDRYSGILHEAQVKKYPSSSDINTFYEFSLPIMDKERQRIDFFYEKKQNEIQLNDDLER